MILGKKLITACLFILFANLFFANLINAEENAAELYLKAQSLLSELPEDFIQRTQKVIKSGWTDNEEEIKEILTKNQEAINIFKQATKLTKCDFTFGRPIVMDAITPFPYAAGKIFSLARLILIESEVYKKEDKLNSALENYLAVLRLVRHLEQQENFILISKMAGMMIQKLLYASLTYYIKQDEGLQIEGCQSLLDMLLFLKSDKLSITLVDAFEEERKVMKNTLTKFLDSPEFDFSTFLIGETTTSDKTKESVKKEPKIKLIRKVRQAIYKEYDKLENEFYPYFIAALRTNDCSTYKEKSRQLRTIKVTPFMSFVSAYPRVLENKLFQWIFSSAIAKTYSQLTIMDYSSIIVSHYISMSKLNILITAVATQFYELKNGKTLDDLQDLVPAYLEKIPEDPFDNFRALKYEKKDTGWFVYSFGPDKQDDHGSMVYNEEETKDNKGDIVFSSF